MTDQQPTPAPSGVAADLLRDADPEVLAALRTQLGMGDAPSSEPTITSAAEAQRAADAFMRVEGTHDIDLVEKPSPTGEIRLNVPSEHGIEHYHCGSQPPADSLIEAIEIHKQAQAGVVDQAAVILTMRRFLEAVLLPGHRERYLARLKGYTRDAAGHTLPPITLPDLMVHATRVLEVYTGRPLGTPPTSGSGGPATSETSTAGA